MQFSLNDEAHIAAADNGSQISHKPFQADYRNAFNGKVLVIRSTHPAWSRSPQPSTA